MTAVHLTDLALRAKIVRQAKSWIGTPYLHQASLKKVGCDCLGLVRGVWRAVYIDEPETAPAYSPDWAESIKKEQLALAARRHMQEISCDEFKAGDLLVFRWRDHVPAKHLAIAVSKTAMVHAQQGAVVCQVPISPWWKRHMAYAFRFPDAIHKNQKGPS